MATNMRITFYIEMKTKNAKVETIIYAIGARDSGYGAFASPLPPHAPKMGKIFLGNYHVKFGHLVNFSIFIHTFSDKNVFPKVD